MRSAFVTPTPLTNLTPTTALTARRKNAAVCPRMVVDPVSVGTGYAFLDSFKGVVIGPTVNEVMSAICGGTVGVMGTIIALEVRRQRVKERKQCPYCRGTGKLPCGACYSVGTLPSASAIMAQEPCDICSQSGYLRCNHVCFGAFWVWVPSFLYCSPEVHFSFLTFSLFFCFSVKEMVD